jgi:hypothetical protein
VIRPNNTQHHFEVPFNFLTSVLLYVNSFALKVNEMLKLHKFLKPEKKNCLAYKFKMVAKTFLKKHFHESIIFTQKMFLAYQKPFSSAKKVQPNLYENDAY